MADAVYSLHMFGLTAEELKTLRKLDRPWKIQDFLETIQMNPEPDGDTCMSPRRVLREGRAHCIEAAMLAALAFRLQGQKPLVVDLTASKDDFDHVIAVFKWHGAWGAISKSNHAVLRYREPIYVTVRELVMSYFHEYTDAIGRKTLRSFTRPVDLSRFDANGWITREDDVWEVPNYLVDVKHYPILSPAQRATLRRADPIEQRAGELLQWSRDEGSLSVR